MYFGPTFAPISLLGLLFKEGAIAGAVPNTQVSVIVPVYNGEETIERCIKHIQGQSIRPFEVIVVDDGSSDMTPFMLGELVKAHPNLRIIRNRENMGKAGAVTAALEHVNSPYTAIIDADTYLDPDYIKNTLGAFHGEKIVAASGMVLPSDSEDLVSSSRLIEYLHSQSTYKQIQNKMGVTFVSPGCCSVWRTSWIKERGIPTETLVEDMDITWEAQIEGNRIAYAPEALAYTEEPETVEDYVKQISRWFSWRPVVEKHRDQLSRGLKILLSWMLAESVGYVIWLALMLFFLYSGRTTAALFMVLLDLLVISFVSAYQGLKLGFSMKKVLRSIPYYYLLRIPTAAVFWRSLISPKRKGW